MIQLRPYQQDFVNNVRNEFLQNHKHVVGVAPCGAGKTIITGWMIKESARRGKKSIFFVHRKELIEQTAKTFAALDIPFGVICSGVKSDLSLPVQIASVQTLAVRLQSVKDTFSPDFLICDECHHILANTYKKILNAFPNAFLLGVTATPLRTGGKTLHEIFDSMVISLSVNQLIKLGNLTKFDYFAAPVDVDLSGVHTKNGDFDTNDLEKAMASKEITGNIVSHYLNYARDKSAICYCVNVNHSKDVAAAFSATGISAAHVDGDTKKDIRAALVEDFRQGKIQVLCNAELFGEGFDVPKCQAVILARPTKSLTLFIQQSMRSMRPDPDDPNKVATIIDCVQNRERHGLPNKFHEWSLIPEKEKTHKCPICNKYVPVKYFQTKNAENGAAIPFISKGKNIFLKSDKDGSAVKLSALTLKGETFFIVDDTEDGHFRRVCPKCGYLFPIIDSGDKQGSKHPEFRDGDIQKLNVSFVDKQLNDSIVRKPISIEDFLAIAEIKNYKIFWAAKNALKNATSYQDCLHIAKACNYNPGWAFHMWEDIKLSAKASSA